MRGLPTTMVLAVCALFFSIAPAAADPAPPAEPLPTPPVEFIPQQTGIGNPLAQSGSPTGPLGLPDLSAYGPNMLLAQNTAPAAPGASTNPVVPNLSAFNPEYLLGQNTLPAAPGHGTLAPGLAPNEDIPGSGRIAFLRRLYDMYQAGALKGSLLGQQSPSEFTAPPSPPTG